MQGLLILHDMSQLCLPSNPSIMTALFQPDLAQPSSSPSPTNSMGVPLASSHDPTNANAMPETPGPILTPHVPPKPEPQVKFVPRIHA